MQRVSNRWLFVVTCGCFALFGILNSTLLAHFSFSLVYIHFVSLAAVAACLQASLSPAGPSASYCRYSSKLQSERSNADQRRKCQSDSEKYGYGLIQEALEFADEAVSGAMRDRKGFNAMLAAARAGHFKVLFVENLSRLARNSIVTLETLKELVHVHHVRIISLDDGVDTDNGDSWEILAAVFGMQNEQYLRALSKFVHRGLEGVILDGFCAGDYCFGYSSEPVPGTIPDVRASDRKPKTKYIILRENAAWVVVIFEWFVLELRSLAWIAKELNRLGVPKDHRASTKEWRPEQLPALLSNKKYVGVWEWGKMKNVRDPMTGQTRQEPRSPEEYAKWTRTVPELQIVDELIFAKAQDLLRKNKTVHATYRDAKGRLRGSSPQSSAAHPKHLLHGLLKCAECQRTMIAGGRNGKYMVCRGNRLGVCSCKTTVRRSLAERLILEAICERILSDPNLRNRVFEIASSNWALSQQNAPDQRSTLKDALADVERRMARLVDKCERVDAVPEFATRIRELRAERNDFKQKLKHFDAVECRPRNAPTLESVDKELADLRSLLSNQGPSAAIALRNFVGGSILMSEVRIPNRKRYVLRGTLGLRLHAISTTDRLRPDADPASCVAELEEFEIDFRLPDRCEEIAGDVKRLWDEGLTDRQIAAQLDCGRPLVKKARDHWFGSHGQRPPDGRSCRKRLKDRRKADQLREEIMARFHDGVPIMQIAVQFQCCAEIIREAVEKWHREKGLPVPDGRTRRRELRLKKQRLTA